jgi:hypothetical protein
MQSVHHEDEVGGRGGVNALGGQCFDEAELFGETP